MNAIGAVSALILGCFFSVAGARKWIRSGEVAFVFQYVAVACIVCPGPILLFDLAPNSEDLEFVMGQAIVGLWFPSVAVAALLAMLGLRVGPGQRPPLCKHRHDPTKRFGPSNCLTGFPILVFGSFLLLGLAVAAFGTVVALGNGEEWVVDILMVLATITVFAGALVNLSVFLSGLAVYSARGMARRWFWLSCVGVLLSGLTTGALSQLW